MHACTSNLPELRSEEHFFSLEVFFSLLFVLAVVWWCISLALKKQGEKRGDLPPISHLSL